MIGTIRKHSKWLWAIIITITIISFVVFFNPSSKLSSRDRGEREGYYGSIAGEPIKLEDLRMAQNEAAFRYFFNYGDWPDQNAKRMGFDLERDTYFRLLLYHKLKQFDIHVADETVAKVAALYLSGMNRGRPVAMDVFDERILRPRGLTLTDFERFIRHDLGIQQLITAAGLSGKLVTPQEARLLYEREHEEIATDAVFFSATNFLTSITTSPEAVSEYFTNQMARYRLPERVQVSYVAFEYSNFLAQAETELSKTNFNELIEANFAELGTNYYKEAKTPEEVKAKIRADLILKTAEPLARRQAYEFVKEASGMTNASAAAFDKLAQEKKLTVKVTEPFDVEEGPKDIVVGADFVKEAFKRSAEEPLAGPFMGRDAAYAIAFNKRLPSEIPPLEKIRDQVTADYKHDQAVQAARKAGADFEGALTNGVAAGKKFSEICKDAGVKPEALPPISLSTRALPQVEEHVSLNQFKQAAWTAAKPGQASPFIATAEGGFVVFVRERLPLQLAKITAELPEFLQRVRLNRQNEAYSDWFRKEAERGLRDTPLGRPQQPQLPGTAKK